MGGNFFVGTISFGRVVVPSPKIVINLPRLYEENLIGSAVSVIIRYKQTDRHTNPFTLLNGLVNVLAIVFQIFTAFDIWNNDSITTRYNTVSKASLNKVDNIHKSEALKLKDKRT